MLTADQVMAMLRKNTKSGEWMYSLSTGTNPTIFTDCALKQGAQVRDTVTDTAWGEAPLQEIVLDLIQL